MANEQKDAKQEEAQTSVDPSTTKEEQATNVSQDAKTENADGSHNPFNPIDVENAAKDYQTKYEEAVKAMKQEREARKEEQEKAQKLEERLQNLKQNTQEEEGETSFEEEQDKTIALINSDPFAQENLDLVEEKVRQGMDVRQAIDAVKAELLDRINAEGVSKEEINKPNLEKPTSASEPVISDTKDRITLKDALAGKVDIDPAQLEAIRNHLPREE